MCRSTVPNAMRHSSSALLPQFSLLFILSTRPLWATIPFRSCVGRLWPRRRALHLWFTGRHEWKRPLPWMTVGTAVIRSGCSTHHTRTGGEKKKGLIYCMPSFLHIPLSCWCSKELERESKEIMIGERKTWPCKVIHTHYRVIDCLSEEWRI